MGKLTDELVDKICAEIAQGIAINEACALFGVTRRMLSFAVDGDDPPHPEWRLKKDAAKAKAFKYWKTKGEKYGDAGNNAGVKLALGWMMALDPRFRKEHQEAVRGIVFNVTIGETTKPIEVEARVVAQAQIPPGAKGE